MNQSIKGNNFFDENYNGVLTHQGTVKVAKTKIYGKILDISNRNVLMRGRLGSYVAEIHKDLYPFIDYIEAGDTGYIKWRNGKAWFVGFKKSNATKSEPKPTDDAPVSENMNWTMFFNIYEME